MKIAVDGDHVLGTYRVDCECGTHWSGRVVGDLISKASPALPIAEVVVHMRLAHEGQLLDLRFSERFRRWLQHYWELASLEELTKVFNDSVASPRV